MIGTLLSTAGMFTLTNMFSNLLISFSILAGLMMLWVLIIGFSKMVEEPKTMNEKEAKRMNKKSVCAKMYSSLKQVYKACKQDSCLANALIVCFIMRNGAMIISFSYFSWIQ